MLNHLSYPRKVLNRPYGASPQKGAPFTYHGRVHYPSHQGSKPMSIVFGLDAAVG